MWVHVKWGVTIIVKIKVAEAKTCSLLSPRMSLRCWNLNSASTVRLSGPCLLNQQIFQPCLYMADLCYKFEVKRLNLLHLRQLFIEHLENSSTQSTNLMECYVSGAPLCGNTRELTDTWTMIDRQGWNMTEWWILLLFYTVWWICSYITILYVLTTHIVVGVLYRGDAGCTENRQLYSCVVTVDAAAWWDWRPWPGKHPCLPSAPILCVCVCVCWNI